MISWSYLDKRDATIHAMKDYDAMKFIVENTSDEIKEISEKMTSIGVPKYDDHVRSGNVHAGEDSTINKIEEIDTLKERYRQALEYMAWFEPAWNWQGKCARRRIAWRFGLQNSTVRNGRISEMGFSLFS